MFKRTLRIKYNIKDRWRCQNAVETRMNQNPNKLEHRCFFFKATLFESRQITSVFSFVLVILLLNSCWEAAAGSAMWGYAGPVLIIALVSISFRFRIRSKI